MIGTKLSHFRIVDKLGEGGMGEIYLAMDERLERQVAIKVLPAGALADEDSRRRFRKEALALSRLNHPNIETVHDFDTQEGVDFLVMEYVPGQTLAGKLAKEPLPEKEVAALGVQVASALEEAHEHGVVHCDLKPANILVTPKHQAKVLDFGLARLLRPVGGSSQVETLSQTGAAAGTLPYMAPEQLRGERADGRTDIFALGAVLYEMATGRRAFAEESAPRLTDAILHQPVVAPRALNARVSTEMERVILKCLEKEPEVRYQSAKEVTVDLRRLGTPTGAVQRAGVVSPRIRPRAVGLLVAIAGAATLALLFGLNVGGLRDRLFGGGGPSRIDSLAVLPLTNLSRDPEQDYFTDGMTEELIATLAKISALKVISRTSVMQFKGARKPLPEIARQLGVDAIVEGSVLRAGDRVRITAQLVEAATDRHLWAESYERGLRDVLALQADVAKAIAGEVRAKLTPRESAGLASARAVNPEAHEAYLKGRYHWNKRTEEGFKRAIGYFEEAISKEPGFAVAYAGLADAYSTSASWGYIAPGEACLKARAAALKALEIDDSLAEAHTAMGGLFVSVFCELDWQSAERSFRRAIGLSPNYATAHHWYGLHLAWAGKFDECAMELEQARELDPLSMIINTNLGRCHLYARRYDRAISQIRKAIEIAPDAPAAREYLGIAYEQLGMYPEAINELRTAVALAPRLHEAAGALGHAYGVSGNRDAALEILNELKQQKAKSYVPSWSVALVYMGLGDKEQALAWLERSWQEGSFGPELIVDMRCDPIREEPRFADPIRRLGLPGD